MHHSNKLLSQAKVSRVVTAIRQICLCVGSDFCGCSGSSGASDSGRPSSCLGRFCLVCFFLTCYSIRRFVLTCYSIRLTKKTRESIKHAFGLLHLIFQYVISRTRSRPQFFGGRNSSLIACAGYYASSAFPIGFVTLLVLQVFFSLLCS